jgi:hypothetical protein
MKQIVDLIAGSIDNVQAVASKMGSKKTSKQNTYYYTYGYE